MDKLITFIKEVKYLLAFFGITGTSSWFNWNAIIIYFETNFISLVLLSSVLTAIFIYILYLLNIKDHERIDDAMRKQHNSLSDTQDVIKDMVIKSDQQTLRAEVKQALKDYNDIEVIDFDTTIRYILGLEKRRIELGVNSYTEDMLKILLNKIKIKG